MLELRSARKTHAPNNADNAPVKLIHALSRRPDRLRNMWIAWARL